jgi:pimeloyl-ACP methyl ester carboxylesterase
LGAQVNNLSCENFNLLENVNYKCGYIDVPYNHFQESQKTINISFVLIDKKNSKEIPLAILTGGPGGSAITQSRVNYWLSSPLSDNRNVIIFDQRGIGFSSKLKNINNEFFSIFRKNLNFTKEKIEVKKLLSTYVDDANNNGIDLSLYNTFQSAVDLDLIMQNLKMQKASIRLS